MSALWLALSVVAGAEKPMAPITARYAETLAGQTVKICLDGHKVKTTFAGPMGFVARDRTWVSFCGDVRRPIRQGQILTFKPQNTLSLGGRHAMAGNIVANGFAEAKSADQCAALQLAVWEALEDGGEQANFQAGRFQAAASMPVMTYAQQFYAGAGTEGKAYYLTPTDGRSQSQISPATS